MRTTDFNMSQADARVAELAKLSLLDYEQVRVNEAEALGIRVIALDGAVEAARPKNEPKEEAGSSIVEEVETWAHPVDGAALADDISADLARHVVFKTPEQADAVALWIMGTYQIDVWSLWPKVLISSPEKRCGKTVLIETIEAHVHRGFLVSNISAAGLFRVIEDWSPTLLIDEADRFLRRNEEANGIINAGHRRRTANVVRVEERNGEHVVRRFSVWGAQVIAGIGSQEETLVDRSIRVALRRRLQSESVEKLPARYFEDRYPARCQLVRWADDNRISIETNETEAPPCGNDRAQDNWTPLFRIAAVLGGAWPNRCLQAYSAIETADLEQDRETTGVRLLRDMAMLMERQTGRMGSQSLRDGLHGIDDAPWAEFPPRGQPISTNRIAAILRDYEVRPRQDKHGSYYDPQDVQRALDRYGPQEASEQATTNYHSATGTNATT